MAARHPVAKAVGRLAAASARRASTGRVRRPRPHPAQPRVPLAHPRMFPGAVNPPLSPRPLLHPGRPTVTGRPPNRPAAPDVGLSRPPSPPGGGPRTPPPTITGTQPPATANGWLHGVGQEITPGPAMTAVSSLLAKTGIYAKAQSANTWARISHKRSTV